MGSMKPLVSERAPSNDLLTLSDLDYLMTISSIG